MQFQVPIHIKPLPKPITYPNKLMLIGSCFTEHIGSCLFDYKFNITQNPHGILFDTLSVCHSIQSYIQHLQYKEEDLFYLNELWHSWHHHSMFSNPDKTNIIQDIKDFQQEAHQSLKQADFLIVTLGSSFSYKLIESGIHVANCHKAPAQLFEKYLTPIDEQIDAFTKTLDALFAFNEGIEVIFTISPVRHIRDGVIDNNRSKARLLETVHHLVNKYEQVHYFPAYEIVIDVLRDYRFYDIDLVHPNYAATQYVMERFIESCIDPTIHQLMQEIKSIGIAAKHKAFHPDSSLHKKFLQVHYEKTKQLQEQYPYLNFTWELSHFASGLE